MQISKHQAPGASMRCGTGPNCHGHADCADLHCPGRGQHQSAHGTLGNVALIAILVGIALVLLAYVGPTAIHHSGDNAQADAIQTAQARDRYLTAAAKLCGINAAVIEQADGSLRCALHNGRKTARVAMVAP